MNGRVDAAQLSGYRGGVGFPPWPRVAVNRGDDRRLGSNGGGAVLARGQRGVERGVRRRPSRFIGLNGRSEGGARLNGH